VNRCGKLSLVFQLTWLNYLAVNGTSGVNQALPAQSGITIPIYSARLVNLGVSATAATTLVNNAVTTSIASEEVGLAEHHIYGSSRLGIQHYDLAYGGSSNAVLNALKNRNVYGTTSAPGTFYNLNNPAVWYSYSYGDLIERFQKTPWANWGQVYSQ
jgi:hypothetical protein